VKISDIKVGRRSRKDPGDIRSLAQSIESTGLLHPIAITPDGCLIAGSRRIEAFKLLGREEIPHRVIDCLDDALKILQAERDENTERKALTPSEALELAERLEPLERKAAKERQKDSGKIHGRGQPAIGQEKFSGPIKGRASDRVASAVGLSSPTLAKIKAVTEAAKQNPRRYQPLVDEMDRTGRVDRASKQLGRMKAEEAGTLPEEAARRDPEWRWTRAFHDLYKFMNSTRDAGGIEKLVSSWPAKARAQYLEEIRKVISVLQRWASHLERRSNGTERAV
jgi:ParB-like chromosome segregation protein Spo0J